LTEEKQKRHNPDCAPVLVLRIIYTVYSKSVISTTNLSYGKFSIKSSFRNVIFLNMFSCFVCLVCHIGMAISKSLHACCIHSRKASFISGFAETSFICFFVFPADTTEHHNVIIPELYYTDSWFKRQELNALLQNPDFFFIGFTHRIFRVNS